MQILVHTASDTGFEWISGVLAASAESLRVRRAADWESLARDAGGSALVLCEEGETEWLAPSWVSVRERLESLGAPWILYLSVFDFSSQAREEAFTRRITLQRKPCGAQELLKRVEDLAIARKAMTEESA